MIGAMQRVVRSGQEARSDASGQTDPHRPTTAPDGVLALVADRETAELVGTVLRQQNIQPSAVVEERPDNAPERLRRGAPPALLLLDLSGSSTPVGDVMAALTAGGGEMRLIALGTVNDVALFRDLMAAGVADYLVKPIDPYALATALTKAVRPPDPVAGVTRLGKTLVFFGSRGGIGTTSLAVNSAWLLAHQLHQRTGLLDLDLYFGTVALALDIDPGRGLREALEQPSRIDGLFVERAMVNAGDRLSVLSAEEPVHEDAAFDPLAIDVLLHELRQQFDWVIVDLPRGAATVQRVTLAAASHIAIVCDQSLAGLRDAMRMETLAKESAPEARILFVDGGATAHGRGEIDTAAFEKGLGRPLDWVIPSDPKAAIAAANSGKPLPVVAASSPVTKALTKVLTALAGPPQAAAKRPFWKRAPR